MAETNNVAKWYVLHTYSGYENKVANSIQTIVELRSLQDLICEVRIPRSRTGKRFRWNGSCSPDTS